MELADFIQLGHQEPALGFLIIGGYAVAAHGHTRATFDVDLLVRRVDQEAWFRRLAASGLKLFGQTRTFAQFSQQHEGDGLDLMFIEESTIDRIWQASEGRDFGGSRARIPCLDHRWHSSSMRLNSLCHIALRRMPKMWKSCCAGTD